MTAQGKDQIPHRHHQARQHRRPRTARPLDGDDVLGVAGGSAHDEADGSPSHQTGEGEVDDAVGDDNDDADGHTTGDEPDARRQPPERAQLGDGQREASAHDETGGDRREEAGQADDDTSGADDGTTEAEGELADHRAHVHTTRASVIFRASSRAAMQSSSWPSVRISGGASTRWLIQPTMLTPCSMHFAVT